MKKPKKRQQPTKTSQAKPAAEPQVFNNRELNRLAFIGMILDEAADERHPLLERLKFMAFFSSNMDEFFMVRMPRLLKDALGKEQKASPDGMTPTEQLDIIIEMLGDEVGRQEECWHKTLKPSLAANGISLVSYSSLEKSRKKALDVFFDKSIAPHIVPLVSKPGGRFPDAKNLGVYLAVLLKDGSGHRRKAIVRVPTVPGLLSRLIEAPSVRNEGEALLQEATQEWSGIYIWMEDVLRENLHKVFHGMAVEEAYPFRVTRNALFNLKKGDPRSTMQQIEEALPGRFFSRASRFEVSPEMPKQVRNEIRESLGLPSRLVFETKCPLDMSSVMELLRLNAPHLKDESFRPAVPESLIGEENMFEVLDRQDMILYNPYDSFEPFLKMLREAAVDPDVKEIKMSLYRIEKNPPIPPILVEARQRGKKVTILIELQAKFDEENNIRWAKRLERAGIRVLQGVPGLKVHSKVCLITKKAETGKRFYSCIGTGNFNSFTARVYTDICLFTSDQDIGVELDRLFNYFRGKIESVEHSKLLISPWSIKQGIISRIDREIIRQREHGDGHIIMKLNNILDEDCIQALYRASGEGVRIDMQVRGICCLRPGVPGLSENISESTIVGRFLEHTRIYYFRNGGDEEVLIGSADLMPRNLYKRVEVLVPILDKRIVQQIKSRILDVHLLDSVNRRDMLPDGSYAHTEYPENLDTQKWMIENRGIWNRTDT